jgi:hypothetical protein
MSRHNQTTLAIALLCAGCLLPLATSALALEGVEAIEEVWEDSIAADNYLSAIGDMTSQPPGVPEGIRGSVRYADWSPARFSWVKGRAEEDSTIKRWVNTSMWGALSSSYVMNANYDFMYIPYHHKYFMSGFCWNPPDSTVYPPQPVDEPPDVGAGAAVISPVYLTPYKYGNTSPDERLAMEVNIWLTTGLAW